MSRGLDYDFVLRKVRQQGFVRVTARLLERRGAKYSPLNRYERKVSQADNAKNCLQIRCEKIRLTRAIAGESPARREADEDGTVT